MPYADVDELPLSLRRRLPPHAQEIYLAAFNDAWASYAGRPDHEAIAHRVAWAAVKRRYTKTGDRWTPRPPTRRRGADAA